MLKSILLFCCWLINYECKSQDIGILPLTGIKYFREGLGGKIDIRADGSTLVSNRLPVDKEIEIKLLAVNGFVEKNKLFFPAAEIIIVSSKGDILSKVPNVMKDNQGFSTASFKDIGLKLALPASIIKNETACTIKVRFYDLKGTHQLRLEFPVVVGRPGESISTSKTVKEIKSVSSWAIVNGIKLKNIQVSIDTSIRVSPKMAYTSLVVEGIDGTTMNEVLGGRETFSVYDKNLNEVKISDKLLKQVKGAMEDNMVEYTLKVPYRLKTNREKYTVRFRWESRDMKKILDIVTNN